MQPVEDRPWHVFVGYCCRCGDPLQDKDGTAMNYRRGICVDCIDEAWAKAVSRGGFDDEVEARAERYMNEWRDSPIRGIL